MRIRRLLAVGVLAAGLPLAGGALGGGAQAGPCKTTSPYEVLYQPVYNPLTGAEVAEVRLILHPASVGVPVVSAEHACVSVNGSRVYGGTATGGAASPLGQAAAVQACATALGGCVVNQSGAVWVTGSLNTTNPVQVTSGHPGLVCVGTTCVGLIVDTGLTVHYVLDNENDPAPGTPVSIKVCWENLGPC